MVEDAKAGSGAAPARPLPVIEAPALEYWEGARRGELIIQRCGNCGYWVHPPLWSCPQCQSTPLVPTKASGEGTIYGFSVMHLDVPGFTSPFGVAVIELAEQPGLITIGNVVDLAPDEYRVGTPVTVTFEGMTDEITLPQWRVRA